MTNLQLSDNVTNYLDPKSFDKFCSEIYKYNFNGIMQAKDWNVLFRILYGCGLRVSEALTLQQNDFDLEHQILTIQHAKTSKKKCPKCTRYKKDNWKKTLVIILDDCKKCQNERVINVPQHTTILKNDLFLIEDYFAGIDRTVIFPTTRQTVWNISKILSRKAGLNLFEQQDERSITDAWTHLFRKSRAKLMEDLGCKRSLIQTKLRHTFKEAIDTYLKKDINSLLYWENENL